MPEHLQTAYRRGSGASIPGMEDDVKRLRQTWAEHRDGILAQFVQAHPGRRPCGFWLIETPDNDPPSDEAQASWLRRHGLLLPDEAARLTAADFAYEETADAHGAAAVRQCR